MSSLNLLVNDAKAAQLATFFENRQAGGARIIHEFLKDRTALLARIAELEQQLNDASAQHAAAVSNWGAERRELHTMRDALIVDLNELKGAVRARDEQIKKISAAAWVD